MAFGTIHKSFQGGDDEPFKAAYGTDFAFANVAFSLHAVTAAGTSSWHRKYREKAMEREREWEHWIRSLIIRFSVSDWATAIGSQPHVRLSRHQPRTTAMLESDVCLFLISNQIK